MEALEAFYDKDLLPELEKLETRRLTVKKKLNHAIFLFVLLNLVVFFVAGKMAIAGYFSFIFLVCSGILIFFFWHIKYFRDYHTRFKDAVIPKIVSLVDPRLQYNKSGCVPESDFVASHLFNDTPGDYYGDDLVTATLGETAIRFSEIQAKRVDVIKTHGSGTSVNKTKRRVIPIFSGLFFVADFNKRFNGTTVVLPDTAQKLFGDLGQALQAFNVDNGQLVKLEDPEFEKLFVVFGQDQVEARYVLSPSLMQRLVEFQKKTDKKMRLSFSASKLYVAIPFEETLFEPGIRESLLNIDLYKKYYDDLKLVADIVEELNLNTRIWTRSGQETPDSVASTNVAAAGISDAETVVRSYDGPGSKKRYTEEETKALFKDFVRQAEPRLKTAKRWGKRVAAVFFLLIGLPFLLSGTYTAGLIFLALALFFAAGGFLDATKEKLAGTVIFITAGILIAFFAWKGHQTSLASTTWPTAGGKIIRSEIERSENSSASQDADMAADVPEYAKISYEYTVGGKRYVSSKISFSVFTNNPRQVVARYPKGKTVRVYYHPEKPNQAVLVPGAASANYAPYIFAGVFIMLGAGLLSMLRRQSKALGNV